MSETVFFSLVLVFNDKFINIFFILSSDDIL